MNTQIRKRYLLAALAMVWATPFQAWAHEQQLYLSRYVPNLKYASVDLTDGAKNTAYKPIFGEGDKDADHLNGISRMGELTVGPGGASAVVSRPNEEYVLYVTKGSGTLIYGKEKAPLRENDFLYVPAAMNHGIQNKTDDVIKVLFMGYHLMKDDDFSRKSAAALDAISETT